MVGPAATKERLNIYICSLHGHEVILSFFHSLLGHLISCSFHLDASYPSFTAGCYCGPNVYLFLFTGPLLMVSLPFVREVPFVGSPLSTPLSSLISHALPHAWLGFLFILHAPSSFPVVGFTGMKVKRYNFFSFGPLAFFLPLQLHLSRIALLLFIILFAYFWNANPKVKNNHLSFK